MTRTLHALLPGLALLCLPLGADDTAPIPNGNARRTGTFTFHFENDFFGGTDRHYTNGAKWSWLFSDLGAWGREGWRKDLLEAPSITSTPG